MTSIDRAAIAINSQDQDQFDDNLMNLSSLDLESVVGGGSAGNFAGFNLYSAPRRASRNSAAGCRSGLYLFSAAHRNQVMAGGRRRFWR